MVAWLTTVILWTTASRVADQDGFVDVVIETIQSPAGLITVSDHVVAATVGFAKSQGRTLSADAQATVAGAITTVISGPTAGQYLRPTVARARDALLNAPDGPVTIDLADLRSQIETAIQQMTPTLPIVIPPVSGLTVTLPAADIPAVAKDIAHNANTIRALPLWLIVGGVVLISGAMLISGDRKRTARRIGIAFLVIAVVPLLLRLVVPPIVASIPSAGISSDVASVTATSLIANWWIALLVSVFVGLALVVPTFVRHRGPRYRGPIVLGH